MSQPSISKLQTWRRHETVVLGVFSQALSDLRQQPDLPSGEDPLNRRLYFAVQRTNVGLCRSGNGIPAPVVYEACNQPDLDDESRATREKKRPDFQWGFVNLQEPDDDRASMFYTVECKRLRSPERADWVFNENYVNNGVARFVEAGHGYAKSADSAAMVGYVQDMSLKGILAEVNASASPKSLPALTLGSGGWQRKGVSRLDQQLNRRSPMVSPLDLRHLWVDLR